MPIRHTLSVNDIKLLRSYLGKLLSTYSWKFNDEILDEIHSEILISLHGRGYLEKFQGSTSSVLYLEARSGIGRYFQRMNAKKRNLAIADESNLLDSLIPHPGLPLDEKIDLKGFCERLTEDELSIIRLYKQGYDYPEISGFTGMSLPSIEKKIEDLRVYASQHFDTSEKTVLYAKFQKRLSAKRDLDKKARADKQRERRKRKVASE